MSYNQYGDPYGNPYKYANTGQTPSNYNNYGPPSTSSYQNYAQPSYNQQYHAQHPQHAQYSHPSALHNQLSPQSQPNQQHNQAHQAQVHNQYGPQAYNAPPQVASSPTYGPPSTSNFFSSTASYGQYGAESNAPSHMHAGYSAGSTTAGYSAWHGRSYQNDASHQMMQRPPAEYGASQSSHNPYAVPNHTIASQYGNDISRARQSEAGPSPAPSPIIKPEFPKQAVANPSPSSSTQHVNQARNKQPQRSSISQSNAQIRASPKPTLHTIAPPSYHSAHTPAITTSVLSTSPMASTSLPSPAAPPVNVTDKHTPLMPAASKDAVGQHVGHMPAPPTNLEIDSSVSEDKISLQMSNHDTKKNIKSPASAAPKSDQNTGTKLQPEPSNDMAYDMLLIALSEEYIKAAHYLGPRVALLGDKGDVETYNGLIAAGLCCLEAVLKNFSFPARQEAAITFRYASLVFEETENYEQLEKIISKGILRCDRSKLLDIKYSFYHLLARASFRRNPKAALKALDTHVNEVEGHQNVPWIYALRLLRVTLSLQLATFHDLSVALQHLTLLINHADRNRDVGMIITLSTLEALIHLKTKSPDYIMNCQEAIAKARSLQLRKGAGELRQVWAMLSCVDLACGMLECNVTDVRSKVRETQERIEDLVVNSEVWTEDGNISIAMDEVSTKQIKDYSSGIFELNEDGKAAISIQWLDSPGAYAFGFLLGGIAGIFKCAIDEKNSQYIDGGLDMLASELQGKNLTTTSQASRSSMQYRSDSHVSLQWYLHLYEAFLYCIKTDWKRADKVLQMLRKIMDRWNFRNDIMFQRWITYLQGMIEQGTGRLDAAMESFRSVLSGENSKSMAYGQSKDVNADDDLAILSRINLLFILRSADHAPAAETQQMLIELEELVPPSHRNPALRTAVALISAVLNPREAMTKTKSALRTALQASRASGNAQLLAISMTAMVSIFFTDITVGEQAQQARHVALELTGRAGDPLWIAVANGMALQGELEPDKIKQRHKELDKSVDAMSENTIQLLARSSQDAMQED